MKLLLKRHDVQTALVNIGEHSAMGGPFTLGLDDPDFGHLGTREVTDMSIATSSPGALHIGNETHILGPQGQTPVWSTVSIEAPNATMADALSTAAVFMDRRALERLKVRARLHRITMVDTEGNLQTL
jgi:thiamine biosynthesis lipoprotein